MADSFDPLGLVKAMGPQRDPYSWAELYAQEASKSGQVRDQLKNNLLIQEMSRAERAKEGAADRASREHIAGESQRGQDRRIAERLKQWQLTKSLAEKNFIYPAGSFAADEATALRLGIGGAPKDIEKTHQLVTMGANKVYIPQGTAVAPVKFGPPPLSPNPPTVSTTTDDGY